MNIENFKIVKLVESSYKDVVLDYDNKIMYCEIQYKRDRSSFAGMAFKYIEEKNYYVERGCKEEIVQKISKYEKLYIGCEQNYIEAIRDKFLSERKEYGIEVYFLVYSDVRSSYIIFEELIMQVDKNIENVKMLL